MLEQGSRQKLGIFVGLVAAALGLFVLGFKAQAMILVGLLFFLLAYQLVSFGMKKFREEEEKSSADYKVQKLLQNMEVKKLLARNADNLSSILSRFKNLLADIEKIRKIESRNPGCSALIPDNLEESYRQEKNKAILDFTIKKTDSILEDVNKMGNQKNQISKANEALNLIRTARNELRGLKNPELDSREERIKKNFS